MTPFEIAVLGTDTDDFYDITFEELFSMMDACNTVSQEDVA